MNLKGRTSGAKPQVKLIYMERPFKSLWTQAQMKTKPKHPRIVTVSSVCQCSQKACLFTRNRIELSQSGKLDRLKEKMLKENLRNKRGLFQWLFYYSSIFFNNYSINYIFIKHPCLRRYHVFQFKSILITTDLMNIGKIKQSRHMKTYWFGLWSCSRFSWQTHFRSISTTYRYRYMIKLKKVQLITLFI